ncbi:hypothetical protein GLX_14910 [Komagataeibacter medellinensis NBRC 3288]|uniref:Uncharacterized protein n=1 Tax=Komagataeibacter medellinensis (strain NBRC 3288 / BCRC 11682 / LMG 1693 / Kondo 51) TaxID=634177 RepID=G2I706_KOMMN|nr:hypothetical protein GLX_14910 [Komagataeibacter medellinensis NBRC 3288]
MPIILLPGFWFPFYALAVAVNLNHRAVDRRIVHVGIARNRFLKTPASIQSL